MCLICSCKLQFVSITADLESFLYIYGLQFSVESGKLDFGRVELYSTYTEYIAVQNKNPVEVRLKSWGSNSSFSQVELVGMQKGVMEDLPRIRDFDNLKKSVNTAFRFNYYIASI